MGKGTRGTDCLKVVEQPFASVQGEGGNIGKPCVFVRLWGCNLCCSWCDTPYSWKEAKYTEMLPQQIVEEIDALPFNNMVVITGGEPMLQDLWPLIKELAFPIGKREVCIETNGTIAPSFELAAAVNRWTVSPKMPSSGLPYGKAINIPVLESFRILGRTEFKFVVSDRIDALAAVQLSNTLDIVGHFPIVFQPVNNDIEVARDVIEWLKAKDIDFIRVLPQWHVSLYKGERGR